MNGDLSLSESLGGLRIANPDDEALAGPISRIRTAGPMALGNRPPGASHSSSSTVTDRWRIPLPQDAQEAGLDFDPATYISREPATTSTISGSPSSSSSVSGPRSPPAADAQIYPQRGSRLIHRQSLPLGHQAQMQQQYPSHSSSFAPQIWQPSTQSTSQRPVSGIYNQNNNPGSSQGSYRYSSNGPVSPGNGLGRSASQLASRSAAAAMGMATSQRQQSQDSRRETQMGNGPLPPRRNSRRVRNPIASSSPAQSSYLASVPQTNQEEDWQDRGAATTVRTEVDADGRSVQKVIKKGVKDFNFGRTLGDGSYSTVLAAEDRTALKEYAIKVLDKRHIIKEKKVKYVNIERDTLNRLTEHPGIVRLYYTFQDERSLYFVLDLASGGELLGVLKKMGSFDEECTRFYGAQILDSIAYMHSRGVIHRDLKPENVLLDSNMHTKITDFGTAKLLSSAAIDTLGAPGNILDGAETDRAVSFVGTAEYVSPELLNDKNACKASDLWAFGCIVYQLLAGRPPFKAANEYLTFQKITKLDYSFPEGFPDVARDLVERLLVSNPAMRLNIDNIRSHPFFQGVKWGTGLWKQKAPRLKAYVPVSREPIKLNGSHSNGMYGGSASNLAMQQSILPQTQQQQQVPRPAMRNVTELPPPSQLDIDWSPVLTRNNERILKLGNLIVLQAQQSYQQSPNGVSGDGASTPAVETPGRKRFSSFFGGQTTKKRERLVLITSAARVILAAAGGGEKKAKMEIPLFSSGTSWKSSVDAKGLTAWTLDTRDKHLTFEDPRASTMDPDGSKYSTQEWLEAIERAREFAISHSVSNGYSGDCAFNDLGSSLSSPNGSTLEMDGEIGGPPRRGMRRTLRKDADQESLGQGKSGRMRFSKRHSKSGLAAVF